MSRLQYILTSIVAVFAMILFFIFGFFSDDNSTDSL